MQQIDRIAIAPLKLRYGHRKFYEEYLPALGIQTTKEGKNAYITQYEAELLEKYHEARGRGKDATLAFLSTLEHVPNLDQPALERIPVHTETYSTLADDMSRIELLRMAGTLQDLNPVARWLATNWVLQTVATQQIVIIRSVLLVLLDIDKLPRSRRFMARGFEFRRLNDKSNQEWLAQNPRHGTVR